MSHRLFPRLSTVSSIVVIALLAMPALLAAQVGSTTDIITGKITGPPPAQEPIVGATVVVTSIDTHISRSRLTNDAGHFTVVFPDGSGQYRIEIRAIGYTPAEAMIARQADEDRLVANVSLSSAVHTLATITTTRSRGNVGPDVANAGGTGATLTPSQIERLPIDGSDLATLATMAPGVVGLAGSDTTANQFSVAGQRQSLNSTTVDGISFSGTSVPTEGVRNIRVVTNSYDVSRGQFTGGQIATTTRGGTNDVAGSFALLLRNDNFAFGTVGPPTFGQLRNQFQFSGGLGGPIVHDKIFSFSSFNISRRYDDLVSLLNASPATLSPLGISRLTADQFILGVQGLGLPVNSPSVPAVRGITQVVGFQRFDFLLSDDETLTLRADFRGVAQDGGRISVFSLPTAGTAISRAGGGVLAALTSHLGESTVNDFRVYVSHSQTSSDPYVNLPAGRVTVVPAGIDTTSSDPLGYGVSSLTFGGSPAVSQRTFNDYVEASNELSLIPGEGSHRLKLGLLLNIARFGQNISPNQNGTYTYQSMAAFEADSPATFTRVFNVQNTEARALDADAYIGDAFRTGPLQLVYGLRLEGSVYSGAPAFNGAIDSLFHRNTNDWPGEFHASPRLGFTWFVGQQTGGGGGRGGGGGGFGGGGGGGGGRAPSAIVRGGIGEFRAPVPQTLFSSLQSATGAVGAESELQCVGPQIPPPDWAGYFNGTVSPPTQCLQTTVPIDSLGVGARNAVTAFAPDFEAPRAWRASLGVSKRFFTRVTLSLDATYARGVALFGVTDLNLNTKPAFYLSNENNRPVYLPPTAIDPTTGAGVFGASRVYQQYGQVLSLNSNLQSDTRQLTASAQGVTDRGMIYQLAYTYSRVRDQSSFAGGSAVYGFASPSTAGNPNVQPFGTSDLQREHQFVGSMTFPITPLIELTAVAQLNSGQPYSPLVNGDVNGDGVSRNDRAFIFDPSSPTTDPKVAAGMNTLLNAGGSEAACLRGAIGQIAARNSCFGPWTTSLNWQLNIRPNMAGLDRRLTVSFLVLNTLTGLDLLVHGPNHLAGWGQPASPDPVLLSVTGFNTSTQTYNYAVNTHFGQPSALQAYGQPFLFVLSARYNVGPADAVQQLRGFMGAGGRGGGGGGPGAPGAPAAGGATSLADDIADRFVQRLPNPFDQILDLKDTLGLSADQVAKLQASSQVFHVRVDSLGNSIRAQLKNLGANIDATSMFGIMRRETGAVRDVMHKAIDEAQHELTPEQWAKVPDTIKTPPTRGGPGGGGAGGGGGQRGGAAGTRNGAGAAAVTPPPAATNPPPAATNPPPAATNPPPAATNPPPAATNPAPAPSPAPPAGTGQPPQ